MVTFKLVLISLLQRQKMELLLEKKKKQDTLVKLGFTQESSRCTSTRKHIFQGFHHLDT